MQAGIADLGATIEKLQMSEPELRKGDGAGVILELPPHIKDIANALPAETLKEPDCFGRDCVVEIRTKDFAW
ncbi:hypothetical protein N7534_003914 [Penicillium rubens]|nr:hypothetical protein N7534_003914 [Penicillium rubens]